MFLTATETKEKFLSKQLSAESIVKSTLERIEAQNPQVGAFLTVYKERALAKAKELDSKLAEGKPLGQLAAVPVAIKDNIHVKGETTTCASNFLTNYTAPFDATVTKLLEDEDAIIIGKTNLDEFAMGSSCEHSALLQTKNPWNLECSTGGSSGGSAAAVAARLVPLALGSDTGGSIRQPASLCGILGYKPTYGRVSRFGLVAFGSSLDQIGPFATTAEDIGLIMEVIGAHCEKDSTSLDAPKEEYLKKPLSDLKGKKVGVPRAFLKDLNQEARALFDQSIADLEKLGATVIDVDLDLLKYSIAIYYILATAEASTNLARFDGVKYGQRSKKAETLDEIYDLSRQEGFGAEVKRRIMLGTFVLSSGYQDAYYKKAQKVRTQIIEKFHEAFKICDVIAMPTTTSSAFKTGSLKDPLQMYLEDLYTIGANLAGLPAVSVPMGLTENKLPIGLQLLCAQKNDTQLCEFAQIYTNTTKHHLKVPSAISTANT